MPARGTPEYIAECAKMAAIEDFCRQNTSASSTKSSRRRRKEATDEATHDASGAPEGTLGATHLADSNPPSIDAPTSQASEAAQLDAQPAAVNDAHTPSISAALQLDFLSERVSIIEQHCQELRDSGNHITENVSSGSLPQGTFIADHVSYVHSTFERTSKALERTDHAIANVQLQVSRMEEVLVGMRSNQEADLGHLAQDIVKHQVDPRLLEIAMAQRGQTADVTKRINHLETDMVTELSVLKARIHALDARLYQPAPASEMADARISALEARLRHNAVDQDAQEQNALDALSARVHSLEVNRSWPKLDPAPGIAFKCLTTASRLARRLTRFIFDARSALSGFLTGVMFAIFCTFWFYNPHLRRTLRCVQRVPSKARLRADSSARRLRGSGCH